MLAYRLSSESKAGVKLKLILCEREMNNVKRGIKMPLDDVPEILVFRFFIML
jgi:hypothetical protein